MDTSSSNFEFLKQKVYVASQNMIQAARNIVMRNPSIEKVLILERIPRFDPPTTDKAQLKPKLSEYANDVLREELAKCDMREKISIGSHSLPTLLHQNIYGHPERRGYDGVQPHGPDGGNFYTRSLCNILQRFLNNYSRGHHNHSIPGDQKPTPETSSSSSQGKFYSPAFSNTSSPTSKTARSDSVFIDMEPDVIPQHFYNIPTSNFYNVLGN